MKASNCVPQTISKYLLGILLAIGAIGLIIIGVTLLPIVGLVMALPVIGLAVYVFQSRLNDQCEIDFSSF